MARTSAQRSSRMPDDAPRPEDPTPGENVTGQPPARRAKPTFRREVARTAVFNVAATVAAGLAGLIIARALGPSVRGEYAAVLAWFGLTQVIGALGQSAATCFFVASDPERGRHYLATSRRMMVISGLLTLGVGLVLSPVLAQHDASLTWAYRLSFATAILAFVGAAYTFSLQAVDLFQWNLVRCSQPLLFLASIGVLWISGLLSLLAALLAIAVTMSVQLALAYRSCQKAGLTHGRASLGLARNMVHYGLRQLLSVLPAALNARLDQLVLSQTVPSADLGIYAVAASLTMLAQPVVMAVGNVAFPRLAAGRTQGDDRVFQRRALLASGLIAVVILLPLALLSSWLVPLLFGDGFRGAAVLIWILAPGGVFLACGQVAGDLLRGRNRPGTVGIAQVAGLVCTVVLLIVLLPTWGVAGAALASSIAYGVALVTMIVFIFKSQSPTKASEDMNRTPSTDAGAE